MKQEENNINLLEHIYDDETMVEVPGSFLYAVMQVLNAVRENETQDGFAHYYAKDSKEVRNEDGTLVVEIKTELQPYPTANSFFNQQPFEFTTRIGMAAFDLLMLAQQSHLQNIQNGLAKKVGTVIPPKDEKETIQLT